MNDYFVFGGRLRTELEFPDLSEVPPGERPDWVFRVRDDEPPEPRELLGTRVIERDWVYRLFRVDGGLRLDYGGIGSFGILAGGREIFWYPGSEPADPELRFEMVRAIVLGPAMAVALQEAGILCLHGSAVTIGEEAVAFLAPKFHGKSTMALALTAAGARLLTDDLVAIDLSASPTVLPGVHSVRVQDDVARRLGPRFSEATLSPGFKTTFGRLAEDDLAWRAAPLAALYVLGPGLEPGNESCASREILSPARAAASIAREKKLTDGLIGAAGAGSTLEWIASVTSRVPVYRLGFVRDLERLSEVASEILSWHGIAEPPGDP